MDGSGVGASASPDEPEPPSAELPGERGYAKDVLAGPRGVGEQSAGGASAEPGPGREPDRDDRSSTVDVRLRAEFRFVRRALARRTEEPAERTGGGGRWYPYPSRCVVATVPVAVAISWHCGEALPATPWVATVLLVTGLAEFLAGR